MHSWIMRRAVVTGGQGFIGRYLVSALRRRGVIVTTLGRHPSAEPRHVALDERSWCSQGLDRVLVDTAPDCIFHLAGRIRGTPRELMHANVGLTRGLLAALMRTGLRPLLVVAGSAAEYGDAIKDGEPIRETAECAPVSAYGASKQAETREALDFAEATGTPVLVARIFNPLGPDMPPHLAFGDFMHQIAAMPGAGGILKVGNIDVRRDMIDVQHVATLLCRLAANPDARGVVNLCSGQAPRLRDLIDMLIEGCGRKVDIAVESARVRACEPRMIVGSTDRLERLGCPPPLTDFPSLLARMCGAVQARAACVC